MDVLKFLREGNKVPNPEYNPKTKKGATQPPFFINTDPDADAKNRLLSVIAEGRSYRNAPINLHPDEYAPYNVFVNNIDTQEELDKERAANQSEFMQVINSGGRTLNQLTVGTVLGAADLASVIVDAMDKDGFNYERPQVVQAISDFKDAIDKRMPIYRENPNAAFDVTDVAWWGEMIPSIVTSVSLAVPGYGVSKAASMLGKIPTLNRMTTKAANILKLTQKTRDIISTGASMTTNGATMRLLENYQEAIQTKDDAKQFANQQLSSMNDEQRATFIKNNPQYADKSDEEIAEDIATNAAGETFVTDWLNLGFDIAQLYGLRNLVKSSLVLSKSSKLRNLNNKAAKQFGMTADEITASNTASLTKLEKARTLVNNLGYDILHGARNEWTEGVEEAINYIAQNKGMELAKLAFDKNTDTKTLGDYLSDAHMWESAFWGVLGGIAFTGVAGKAGEIYNRKFNKEFVAGEKQREQEITNRALLAQQYQEQMSAINNNKNPFNVDKKGEATEIQSESEKELLKDIARKNYTSVLAINAINTGNMDFLETYIDSDELRTGYAKKFGLSNEEATKFQQQVKNDIKQTKDLYLNSVNKALKFGASMNVAQIIAKQHIDANNTNEYNKQINQYAENLFNEKVASNQNINPEYFAAVENLAYANKLTTLRNHKSLLQASEQNDDTRNMIEQIDNEIAYLENNAPAGYDFNDKENEAKAKEFREKYSEEYNIAYNKYRTNLNTKLDRANARDTDADFKKQVNHYMNVFDESRRKIINNALEEYGQLYDKYGDNINNENAIEDADKKKLDTLKKVFVASDISDSRINNFINNKKKKKEAADEYKETADDVIEENIGEETDADAVVDNTVQEEENGKTEPNQSSTGGLKEAINETAGTTESAGTTTATEQPPTAQATAEPAGTETTTDNENGQGTPPVEDKTDEPTTSQKVWDDFAVNDFALEWIGVNIPDILTENAETIMVYYDKYIHDAIANGIDKETADVVWYSIMNGLYGDELSYDNQGTRNSAIDDNDKTMLRAAMLAIMNCRIGNRGNIENVIKRFVETANENGITYGVDIDGKTYFNIEDLVSYIYDMSKVDVIAQYLFDEITNYIVSDDNTKYVATDDESMTRLNREAKANRIKRHAEIRANWLVTNPFNNINVDGIDTNEEQYVNITQLQPGEELIGKASNGRIYIGRKNGATIGYMGIPRYDENTGMLSHINRGWKYDIIVDSNAGVQCKFKDYILDVINNKKDVVAKSVKLNQLIYQLNSRGEDVRNNEEVKRLIKEILPLIDSKELAIYNEKDDDAVFDLVKHFTDIVGVAIMHPDDITGNVNNWFDKIAGSFVQTYEFARNKTKGTFRVADVSKGNIVLKDIADNDIREVFDGYNEDKVKLATVTSAAGIQINDENDLRINREFVKSNLVGTSFFAIMDGHGGYDIAQIAKLRFEQLQNKEAKEIRAALQKEVFDIVQDWIENNPKVDDVMERLNQLMGKSGMFEGIKANKTNNGNIMIGFTTRNDGNTSIKNNNIFHGLIILNEANGTRGRNVSYNTDINLIRNRSSQAGATAPSYKYSSRIDFIRTNREFINCIDSLCDNANINIPFAFAKDKTFNTIDGKYIRRENNKTIIEVGGYKKEYDSYQQFLVENGLIKTKLDKDKNGANYTKNKYVGVNIRFDVATPITTQKQSVDLNSKFDSDELVSRLNQNTTVADSFRAIFAGNEVALNKLNALDNIGIIPKFINVQSKLTDEAGNEVYAQYNPATNEIDINANQFNKQSYSWALRRIVHENLHQQLNNVYSRKDALDKLEVIYNAYEKYVHENHPNEDAYTRFLNIRADKVLALEEFVIESLTNPLLIRQLNEINADGAVLKNKTDKSLLRKLLEVIMDIIGINVNKGSLLEQELDILNDIAAKDNSDTATMRPPVEDEIGRVASPEPLANVDFTDIDNTDFSDTDFEFTDAPFSAVSEDYMADNINDFINGLPVSLQADTRKMLDDGSLTMYCE